jgi:hypothetical protein
MNGVWDKARHAGLVLRTEEAGKLWRELYDDVSADDPAGLLGYVLGRAGPQCLRLSLTYALADGCRAVDGVHLEAARAFWAYARASAALVYGESTGDAQADRLLAELRNRGTEGIDGRTGDRLLGAAFRGARERLERLGLAVTVKVTSEGRKPRQVTVAVRPRNP